MKTRNPRGFSLLELMIVIIVAAILAAFALPSFRTYFIRNNLASSANNLLSAMNTARTEAIKRNAFVRVDPSKCGSTASWAYGAFVWVPKATDPADAIPTGSDARIVSGAVTADGGACQSGANVGATMVSGSGDILCYSGSGRMGLYASGCTPPVISSPLQVRLCDKTNVVKTGPLVDVSVSGRALIQPNSTVSSCP
jgi:prepilin-type N-terminal cleavage/methylation domain-containing protein